MKDACGEFRGLQRENTRIWDKNARWWDDRIGDGNDFQDLLVEPATERLLAPAKGEIILDVACGAGRMARRIAALCTRVVAVDHSRAFIARAKKRTKSRRVEYHIVNAADEKALLALGRRRFDKAVCTMALMDMPEIRPLFRALPKLLKPEGVFVFSVTHPCFNSASIERFAEAREDAEGRYAPRSGVKVTGYLTPSARKGEGIVGQPETQFYFDRPLSLLLNRAFAAGFVVDGIEEPSLPRDRARSGGMRWDDMPDIPPVIVVRMRLAFSLERPCSPETP